MFGPILRGEKCTLRPPRKEEAETYIGWFKDPDVIRYTLQVGPMSIWQEEDFIKRMAEEPNAISWVIEVDGRPVGWTGLGGIHRSEEHTSELQSLTNLVCRLLL